MLIKQLSKVRLQKKPILITPVINWRHLEYVIIKYIHTSHQ